MSQMESPYLVRKGLRLVQPYYYQFNTTTKGRWIGRSVILVFVDELRQPQEYWQKLIELRKLFVLRKSQEIYENATLLPGDRIKCWVHKHEPPVVAGEPKVVADRNNMIVVDKPSGVPAHPTGSYMKNTVLELLKLRLGLSSIYTCHRLDMATSGLLILAREVEIAKKIALCFLNKTVRKTYLAKVSGKFPESAECKDPIFRLNPNIKYEGREDAIPIPVQSGHTIFRRVSYNQDSDSSVVECIPITGRTHQIRIHLRNLGHPIVDDIMYGFSTNSPVKQKAELSLLDKVRQNPEIGNVLIEMPLYSEVVQEFRSRLNTYDFVCCGECGVEMPSQNREPSSLTMCLHAWKVEFPGTDLGSFQTEMPTWAQ